MSQAFVRIPAGRFQMGLETDPASAADAYGGEPSWYDPEQPRHTVVLTRDFELATTPVTRGQFAAFVAATGYRTSAEVDGFAQTYVGTKFSKTPGRSWRDPGFEQADDHPVVCVTHADAVAYCEWLGKTDGRHYRLPTEAEWERAYRTGTNNAWTWGYDPAAGVGHANCADATARERHPEWTTFDWHDGYVQTSPVAAFAPNRWGLFDMAGNAWEWTSDFYAPYTPAMQTDPHGPVIGEKRVLRGGSWYGAPLSSRAAFRSRVSPTYRGSNAGFRIVRELDR